MIFARSLEEKPKQPKSNQAVTGLYFWRQQGRRVCEARETNRAWRAEITSSTRCNLEEGKLTVELLGRGFACWIRAPRQSD